MPHRAVLRNVLLLLLGIAGCGTHSVVVTTQHPAAIDLHDATSLAVSVSDISSASDAYALADALEIHVQEQLGKLFPSVTVTQVDDDVLRSGSGPWAVHIAADHLLHLAILQHSYAEEVSEAEFRQFEGPASHKLVRTGKARAALHVSTYRLSDGASLQSDTLTDTYSMQLSAVDREPAAIDTALCITRLATQVASTLAALSTPVENRSVVTFLTNSDFPALKRGLALVEDGRWKDAERVFSSAADAAGHRTGADEIWYNLGLTRQYLQHFRSAEEAFRQALSLRERSRYRRALQTLLAVEREYQEAVDQGVQR